MLRLVHLILTYLSIVYPIYFDLTPFPLFTIVTQSLYILKYYITAICPANANYTNHSVLKLI